MRFKIETQERTKTYQNSLVSKCLQAQFLWQLTQDQGTLFVLCERKVRTKCWHVVELLKSFLMRRREENDASAVALVTRNVRYALSSLSTSLSMLLVVFSWLSASAIVLTFVTFTLMAEPAKAVLMASGNISSWILKRARPIFPQKYLATFSGISGMSLLLAAPINSDSTSQATARSN